MNCIEVLLSQVNLRPNALAIADPRQSKTLTFAELNDAAQRAATLLKRSHLQFGDAALVFQPMSADLYVTILALFKLGMVAMFVDPSAGIAHLERCCQLYPPQALIASSKAHLLRLRSASLRRIPHKFAIGIPVPGAIPWSRAYACVPDPTLATCAPDHPALITFTSGSTGQPKAAVRSHQFLQIQHRVLATHLHLSAGQVDLTTLPIFVLANLASGVTSLIPDADLRVPARVNAAKLRPLIQQYQPQSTAVSPAFIQQWVNDGRSLPSFQRIFIGGAPVFPNLLEKIQAIAPQAEIIVVYGSTEAEPIAHHCYQSAQPVPQAQGLAVGKPIAEIHLQILDTQWSRPILPMTQLEFADHCQPINAPGEIVVSGAHVLPGYLNGQGDSDTKFRVNGTPWHRTGDVGYLDAQGNLWLLGRCGAVIHDHLGTIYPFAVEVVAQSHATVQRAALVQYQGDRTLILELTANAVIQNSLPQIQQSLDWAKIHRYGTCRQMPVDARHNAKINYPALNQLLERDQIHWL